MPNLTTSSRKTKSQKPIGRHTVLGFFITAGFTVGFTIVPMSSANAGEFLRFKQGTVRTSNFAAMPDWLQASVNSLGNTPVNSPENKLKVDGSRYFVIQFASKITQADRAALAGAGARDVRYVPDDALIVRVSPSAARALSSTPGVRAVVPYNSRWKLSPELRPSVFIAQSRVRVLVRTFDDQETAQISSEVAALPGVLVESESGKSIVATLPMSQMASLTEIEGIEWTQEMPQMTTFEARLLDEVSNNGTNGPKSVAGGDFSDLDGFESGTKVMKLDAAWSRGLDGSGQIGAMADSGLDSGDSSTLFSSFKDRVPSGYAFGLFSTSWADPMGHGTHVAGTVIGAGGPNGDRIRGPAYAAKLVAQGMWSSMFGGLSVPPKLADLFLRANEDGARVHTNSWGSPRNLGAYDGFAQQVDEYAFQNPDFLILFAAGNSGVDRDKDGRIDAGSVASPSTAKNCLTVGASKNLVSKGGIQKTMVELRGGSENWSVEPLASSKLSDNINGLAAFSSRGPTADGRIKPEVVAPGTNILGNRSHEKDAGVLWGAYNDDYVWSGGTSMATPLVAGGALVTRQYLKSSRGLEAPSAALVKATLIHTAFDLFPGGFGNVGKEKGQELLTTRPTMDAGYGRVNLDKATALDGVELYDEKAGVALGETKTYSIRVTQPGHLTATLVWTDAPGAGAAAKTLVNDLDLSIVEASGNEISRHDSINNSEMIEIPVLAGGYEIRVTGVNVPQGIDGKQPFALIVGVEDATIR